MSNAAKKQLSNFFTQRIITFLSLVFLSINIFAIKEISAVEFLPPEKAFLVSAQLHQDDVEILIEPQDGYYVYKESISVKEQNQDREIILNKNKFPKADKKFDENFQKIVETYKHAFKFQIPLSELKKTLPLRLEVTLQGCAQKGICYPPMSRTLELTEYGSVKSLNEDLSKSSPGDQQGNDLWSVFNARDDLSALSRLLETTSLTILLIAFFILGIGLAFTPCMLPMLPILSSVVFGTEHHHLLSRKRTIVLALAYVGGMACTFSLAGMATAWFGSGVQAGLQNPWVLIAFSLLMLLLAGSLLGFYEIQLPQFWHAYIDRWLGKQKGGSILGAFLLGGLSSLVASPCVTAPLAGVLAFIAQSGAVKLGGLILFVMACGMGVPLMMFALGASRLVPRAGAWMVRVQRVFGILMILLAAWVVMPAIATLTKSTNDQQIKQKIIKGLTFEVVRTMDDLKISLEKAKVEKKKVFVNYYADWCVSCKELELLTFENEELHQTLQNYQLIEVDVTKPGKEQEALLKYFEIFGPPAIMIMDEQGIENKSKRSVGYISAEKLIHKIRND